MHIILSVVFNKKSIKMLLPIIGLDIIKMIFFLNIHSYYCTATRIIHGMVKELERIRGIGPRTKIPILSYFTCFLIYLVVVLVVTRYNSHTGIQ